MAILTRHSSPITTNATKVSPIAKQLPLIMASLILAFLPARTLAAPSIKIDVSQTEEITITNNQLLGQIDRHITLSAPRTVYLASSNTDTVTICPHTPQNERSTLNELISTIKVTNKTTGKKLTYTTKVRDNCVSVTYAFGTRLYGGGTLAFRITYTEPTYTSAESLEFLYPAITDYARTKTKTQGKYTITTSLDLTTKINIPPGVYYSVLTPSSFKENRTKDVTQILFKAQDFADRGIYLITGNQRLIRFRITTKQNPQANSQFTRYLSTIKVGVPTNSSLYNQQVYLAIPPGTSLEAYKISLKDNILNFTPTKTVQTLDLLIKLDFPRQAPNASPQQSTQAPETKDNHIPPGVYTPPPPEELQALKNQYPVDHPDIIKIANHLKADSPLQTVKNTVTFVTNTLEYDDQFLQAPRPRLGPIQALKEKKGVCMEYADLTITLLLANDIIARPAYGYLTYSSTAVPVTLGTLGHQWLEVYIPDKGWITVDPTLAETIDHYINAPLAYIFVSNKPQDVNSACIGPLTFCQNTQVSISIAPIKPSDASLKTLIPLNDIKTTTVSPAEWMYKIKTTGSKLLNPIIYNTPAWVLVLATVLIVTAPLFLIARKIRTRPPQNGL